MCLAVPMKVIEVENDGEELFSLPEAIVEMDGVMHRVRLDIVDRLPRAGDYVIVHAGFAIRTMDQEEAMKNLELLRKMAQGAADE